MRATLYAVKLKTGRPIRAGRYVGPDVNLLLVSTELFANGIKSNDYFMPTSVATKNEIKFSYWLLDTGKVILIK